MTHFQRSTVLDDLAEYLEGGTDRLLNERAVVDDYVTKYPQCFEHVLSKYIEAVLTPSFKNKNEQSHTIHIWVSFVHICIIALTLTHEGENLLEFFVQEVVFIAEMAHSRLRVVLRGFDALFDNGCARRRLRVQALDVVGDVQ